MQGRSSKWLIRMFEVLQCHFLPEHIPVRKKCVSLSLEEEAVHPLPSQAQKFEFYRGSREFGVRTCKVWARNQNI